MLLSFDEHLFQQFLDQKACSRPQHCLHHLLAPVREVDKLRECCHPFTLPEYNMLSIISPSLCIHCTVSFRELWLNCFAGCYYFCDFFLLFCYDFILFYFSSCHPTLLVCICASVAYNKDYLLTYLLTYLENAA